MQPPSSSLGYARPLLLLALVLSTAVVARADGPKTSQLDPVLAKQIRQTIVDLDDDEFTTRSKAAEQIERYVDDPKLGPFLADEFSRALLVPKTSLEVRARLETLLKQLPQGAPESQQPEPAASEIGPLLAKLGSDSSAERDFVERRLAAMLKHAELIGPILVELKQKLVEPRLDAELRRPLERLLEKARQAWMLADPASVTLPPVGDDQLKSWIEQLAVPDAPSSLDLPRQEMAHRELIDFMVRDDTRPRLLALLNERLESAGENAMVRIQEILDFAKPAMAAEIWGHQSNFNDHPQADDWEHRQNVAVQHLLIGVPQYPETATRATHFDRIDDKVAHCVSGNTLSEGDYPVGVAIPHPIVSQETMYYLVNLPTPRKRLAYEYLLKRDEHERLLEISRNTLADILATKRVLDEHHVMVLAQLDPRAVSAFVGQYFKTVPDAKLEVTTSDLPGQLTVHGGICYMLTRIGRREAIGALEETARSGRLGKLSYENNPFHIAWIAALAVARRDPWPEVDEWLARLMAEKPTPLMVNVDPAPDLAASAAALLADRHGVSPQTLSLQPAAEAARDQLRFAGFYFAEPEHREIALRWWEKHQAAQKAKGAP